MNLLINGQSREFPTLTTEATVQDLLQALALKPDRVAIEHNGSIVSRNLWAATPISDGDKFEIVHFVGGGSADRPKHLRDENGNVYGGRPKYTPAIPTLSM